MSEDYARQKAYDLIKAAIPTTAIMYQNQPFTAPTRAPFVKVSVQPVRSWRKDMGSVRRIFRHVGVVHCMVLVPEDTGMKTLNDLSHAIFMALADQKFAVPGDTAYLTFCNAKRSDAGTLNGYQAQRVAVEYHMDIVE